MKIKNLNLTISFLLTPFFIFLILSGCSSKQEDIGIGPVKELKLAADINKALVDKGKQIFDVKCIACHKFEQRLVGPPLKDVTKKRKPEWIMNMILNPQQMTQEDKVAKELFAQYLIQMTFQDVSQDDARSILEYFRAVDTGQMPSN
jgi:mono/diheme cytochrome c family protein